MPPETSPHTRGELILRRDQHPLFGNIPAYAGRTGTREERLCAIGKHPRIRGENEALEHVLAMRQETSPHTRGEPFATTSSTSYDGNIPAYAGRTEPQARGNVGPEKHPRIRGENLYYGSPIFYCRETSPHTRGEPHPKKKGLPFPGNIPAYAGRTLTLITCRGRHRKHPRIRGENVVEAKSHKNNMETSPHTRGEPSRETILRELHRNIPAYAGRTSGDVSFYRQVGKHPRIRGENSRKRRKH